MIKKMTEAPVILRSDAFVFEFATFHQNKKVSREWHKLLTLPRYRVSDVDNTYRTVNYWDERGLLLDTRKTSEQWRQFSVVDVVWMRILRDLKSIGLQTEELRKLKEDLFLIKDNKNGYPEFEFWIYKAIKNYDASLVVLPDGSGIIATPQDVEVHQFVFGLGEVVIIINFKELVGSILTPNANKSRRNDLFIKLDTNELDFFNKLRDETFDTVTAYKKDGKIERIEWREVDEKPEKLIQMLREKIKESPNQTIIIKRQDGKVLFVEQKQSKKIK